MGGFAGAASLRRSNSTNTRIKERGGGGRLPWKCRWRPQSVFGVVSRGADGTRNAFHCNNSGKSRDLHELRPVVVGLISLRYLAPPGSLTSVVAIGISQRLLRQRGGLAEDNREACVWVDHPGEANLFREVF